MTGMRIFLTLLSQLVRQSLTPRADLMLENLALRQQLAVLANKSGRPRLRARDRVFWRWKSRPGRAGRPRVPPELRELIRRMASDNPLWGAPRIHGELQMLGFDVSERTVARCMPRRPPYRPGSVSSPEKPSLSMRRPDFSSSTATRSSESTSSVSSTHFVSAPFEPHSEALGRMGSRMLGRKRSARHARPRDRLERATSPPPTMRIPRLLQQRSLPLGAREGRSSFKAR